jgi:hypothetical protein
MKITAFVIAANFLTAIPTLAEPTFTCNIVGSASDGWEVKVTNTLPPYKSCTAECTITFNDGSQSTRSCTTSILANITDSFICGETLASGTPLTNTTITSSCN